MQYFTKEKLKASLSLFREVEQLIVSIRPKYFRTFLSFSNMSTLADTLRSTLSRAQLIELLGQLKDESPLSAALFPAAPTAAAAAEAPMAAAPKTDYYLKRVDDVPAEFRLIARHLGKGFIRELNNIVRPGRDLEDMKALKVPECADNNGYVQVADVTSVPIRALMPAKSVHSWLEAEFSILFAFQHLDNRSYKAALLHTPTGKVVMSTGFMPPASFKKTKAQLEGWCVCTADMTAPADFWNAFKAL